MTCMEMSLHVKNKNWMAKQMMLKMVRVSNWKVDSCSQTVWESVEASQEEKRKTGFRSVREYDRKMGECQISCENHTCTAVGAEPRGFYVQRDIGELRDL